MWWKRLLFTAKSMNNRNRTLNLRPPSRRPHAIWPALTSALLIVDSDIKMFKMFTLFVSLLNATVILDLSPIMLKIMGKLQYFSYRHFSDHICLIVFQLMQENGLLIISEQTEIFMIKTEIKSINILLLLENFNIETLILMITGLTHGTQRLVILFTQLQ